MKIFPLHAADFYKTGHLRQYPEGTQFVYSNFTPRSGHHANLLPDFDRKAVFFGLQGVIQWLLIDTWNREFFERPKDEVMGKFARRMNRALGEGAVSPEHFASLHDLGYLPLVIKALPEGSRVNLRVPLYTVKNTHPDFYWLTNYLETALSAETWKSINNATIAYEYRRLLDRFARETGVAREFVAWQGHDFSMRGMSGIHDAAQSGAAHLLSFCGTDTISAIDYLEDYYGAEDDFVGGSVPATEHSVMCMGGRDDEIGTFRRLIEELYPSGIVSIVSDTWDFWRVITEYARDLKSVIEARGKDANGNAKVVFRPDSGDPVKIICGDPDAPTGSPAHKGAVQCLWEVFGGTVTATGHRALSSSVGLIYGDSITLQRAENILHLLKEKGFASGNIVFGIGSYTYQMSTRDNLGQAIKATWGVVNGEARELFKDPVTDSGVKRSAKGLLRVEREGDDFVLYDQQDLEGESRGALQPVFENGRMVRQETLQQIRGRLLGS
jgi:nicotinamide phosphoribosyltransferase